MLISKFCWIQKVKLTLLQVKIVQLLYTRIPYGITSGPSVFQKIMDQTIKGLKDVNFR